MTAPVVRAAARAPVRPRRLLFVVNNAAFFASHRLPLGRAAIEAGYDVHVACPQSPALVALAEQGFTVHPVPIERTRHTIATETGALRALVRLYRELRPDVVHHVTVKPVLYGSLAARLARVPAVVNAMSGLGYLYTARGVAAALRRGVVEAVYRVAFRHGRLRVIFQNPDDMTVFVRRRLVRSRDTVLVRGSGVDAHEFVPSPEPEADAPVIVLPARLLWDKGVGEFAAAARLLRARGFRFRAVLAGDVDEGNPSSVPLAQLHEWVDEGVVEWWGFRGDMPAVYGQSSIACLPSYREGVPKALLEAAACGRPIVTSDVPGCREVVTDGETGLLVPPRDAAALANALGALLADAQLRARLGAAGRQRVEREFTVELVVAQQLALYRDLLSES